MREVFETAPEFGGSVRVIEAGLAHANPVVLIHGIGKRAAHDFDAILPQLSRHHHVLAFDLPGFGESTRTRDDYSPERYVRFLEAMIARHFAEPVAIVGHSMGAALAILLAADHPERVSRLALLSVAGILNYRDYLLELNAGNPTEPRGTFKSLWRGARAAALRMLSKLHPFEPLDARDRLRPFLPTSTTAKLAFIDYDFGPALRRVRAPTWLGWGQRDRVAPLRTARVLRFMLRPVHDVTFENSGHVPMETEPELLAESLLSYLAEPLPSARRAPAKAPLRATRKGSCVHERDRVFEGDYASIDIRDCEHAVLRHVRTRSLQVASSSVELEYVEIDSDGVGASFQNARVRWTGGTITARVCVESHADELNLAGVQCRATAAGLRVSSRGRLHASVSSFSSDGSERALHGVFDLAPTLENRRGGTTL